MNGKNSTFTSRPYHDYYTRLTQEGHRRPTARLDAPALVWHVAIWPKKDADAQDTRVNIEKNGEQSETKTDENLYVEAIEEFNERRTKIAEHFSKFLVRLQERGRSVAPEKFAELKIIPDLAERGNPPKTVFYERDSLGFTLWWADGGNVQTGCPVDPTADYLRVRVQVDAYLDFISITFCIDPQKSYDMWTLPPGAGVRRKSILSTVKTVTDICDQRIASVIPSGDLLPENLPHSQGAELLKAAEFLYGEIWDQFRRSFEFTLEDIAGDTCEVFANFLGLVLSTKGDEKRQVDKTTDGSTFEPSGAEADRVIAGYFPFVRRAVPAADYRQFTLSGIIGWKAMYISSLGAPSGFAQSDESKVIDKQRYWESNEVPAGHLPEPPLDVPADKARPDPIRYMIFVRNAPDRKQLARLVERMNAMGSTRLFALRDFLKIREASTHVRMRGQELDVIVEQWTKSQDEARTGDEDYDGDARDKYYKDLSRSSRRAERRLIGISAALDEVGRDTVGGLPFRIARASYYIGMFRSLLKSLRVERVEKWMPYDEFVTRGLDPTFEFITGVGTRLEKLRARLQNAMQAVQTSAIVAQTEATRQLSAEARRQSRASERLSLAGILIAGVTIVHQTGMNKNSLFAAVELDVRAKLGFPEPRGEEDWFTWVLAIAMSLVIVVTIIKVLGPLLTLSDRFARANWEGRWFYRISFVALLAFAVFVAGPLSGVLVDFLSPPLGALVDTCCRATSALVQDTSMRLGPGVVRAWTIALVSTAGIIGGFWIVLWLGKMRRLRDRL
ncbi:MAG: DUF3422 family protein [Hyphomicrobiaceae bacterium]|nr:DUF3422 family protein [Hyphomicrobiaceae bacterium]